MIIGFAVLPEFYIVLPKHFSSVIRQKMSTPTGKRQKNEMELDLGSFPTFDMRYDRYCPACSRVIVKSALRKYPGQKCGFCCVEIKGRNLDDNCLFNRCVECDSYIKCTEQYCYNCRYKNEFFDPSKEDRLQAAARKKWEQIFKQEMEDEKALVDAADEFEKSQSEASIVDSKHLDNSQDTAKTNKDE